MEARPVMLTLVLVASIVKILEILAVMPELEAISKKASGVESPSPNLPSDWDEKIARKVFESSYIFRLAEATEKEAPFLNSHSPVMF
jgi:hypothetical protein